MQLNNYGPMAETLKRITAYQQVGCQHEPGYGQDYYRITVKEGSTTLSDVFNIQNDGQLNDAINKLYLRAL